MTNLSDTSLDAVSCWEQNGFSKNSLVKLKFNQFWLFGGFFFLPFCFNNCTSLWWKMFQLYQQIIWQIKMLISGKLHPLSQMNWDQSPVRQRFHKSSNPAVVVGESACGVNSCCLCLTAVGGNWDQKPGTVCKVRRGAYRWDCHHCVSQWPLRYEAIWKWILIAWCICGNNPGPELLC